MTSKVASLVTIDALSAASQNALEDYCHYLLSTLPDEYVELFAEPTLAGKKISATVLDDIATALIDAQQLEANPIAAMVATVAGRSTQEKGKHEALKAWTLIASLTYADRSSTVKGGCVRVRRLGTDDDRWLFEALLKTKNDLKAIVDRLDKLLRTYSGDCDEDRPKYRKVSHLHALLADLYYRREKRGPGPTGGLAPGPRFFERLVTTPIDPCLFPDVENATILSDESQVIGAGHGADYRSSSQRYLDGVANNDYPTVLKQRVRQGRQLAQTFTMRSVAAPCAWEGLSENEVERTISACYDEATHGCRPSLWIVLSLLLGRTPERLCADLHARLTKFLQTGNDPYRSVRIATISKIYVMADGSLFVARIGQFWLKSQCKSTSTVL